MVADHTGLAGSEIDPREAAASTIASDVSDQQSGIETPREVSRWGSASFASGLQPTLLVGGHQVRQPKRKGEDHLVQSPFVSP